jgi:hypothetical protein
MASLASLAAAYGSDSEDGSPVRVASPTKIASPKQPSPKRTASPARPIEPRPASPEMAPARPTPLQEQYYFLRTLLAPSIDPLPPFCDDAVNETLQEKVNAWVTHIRAGHSFNTKLLANSTPHPRSSTDARIVSESEYLSEIGGFYGLGRIRDAVSERSTRTPRRSLLRRHRCVS